MWKLCARMHYMRENNRSYILEKEPQKLLGKFTLKHLLRTLKQKILSSVNSGRQYQKWDITKISISILPKSEWYVSGWNSEFLWTVNFYISCVCVAQSSFLPGSPELFLLQEQSVFSNLKFTTPIISPVWIFLSLFLISFFWVCVK